MIRLVPVLDIANGSVVRAIGGRRDEYGPIDGGFGVTERLSSLVGHRTLYVADLDAIRFGRPCSHLDSLLSSWPGEIWLDDGLIRPTLPASIRRVFGTESLREQWPIEPGHKSIVSIDLQNALPMYSDTLDPHDLIASQFEMGFRSFILLDLASVGERRGPSTLELCRWTRRQFPNIELISGGGIRDRDDVARFEDAGVDAVLVATALHDGTLP